MSRLGDWFKSWRLVSWRSAVVLAVVLYTLVGFVLVPYVAGGLIVDAIRDATGREPRLEAVRCNPYTLSFTVRGFSMPDRPGTTLLSFDELYANAQLSSLFRLAPTLKILRVRNPYVGLRRFDDGTINVVELGDEVRRRAAPDVPSSEPEASGGLPRLLLHHILIDGTTVEIEDYAREEPLHLELGPSVFELFGISTLPDRSGTNDLSLGLMGGGTIDIDGDVVVDPLGLSGTVTMTELMLDNTWPILRPYFEFDLVGGQTSGNFDYAVSLTTDGLHVRIDALEYHLDGLQLESRDPAVRMLEVDEVTIQGGHVTWPEGQVGAAGITVAGGRALAWMNADGTFSWETLVPEPTGQQVIETYHKVEEALPWSATVDRLEVRDSSAIFEDRSFEPALRMTAEGAALRVEDVTTEPGKPWKLETSVELPGGGTATAEGTFTVGPFELESAVGVEGMNLGVLAPYVARELPVELLAGRLSTTGQVHVAPKDNGPLAGFTGELEIDGIDLRETALGSRLLRWGTVRVAGIDAGYAPLGLRVDRIDVHDAGIDVLVDENGKINLVELLAAIAETSDDPAQPTEANARSEAPAPPLEIGVLALHACAGRYIDRTLSPAFEMALDPIDGELSAISSTAAARAQVAIEGRLKSGGTLLVAGEVAPFDPKRLADLTIDVREIELPPLSPMLVRALGYPADAGAADVGLDYEIVDSRVTGRNRLATQSLALGEKVEGQGIAGVPVKLGVSLLTDKNGRIQLEFPVEGNLDDPNFGIGNAIGSAAKEVVGQLARSPFRLLGKLGGGKADEDYAFVEFAAGETSPTSNAQSKLQTVAAGLAERPDLVLEVAGVWGVDADAAALREAALADALAGPESGSDVPALERLEAVYRRQAAGEPLETVRERFMTAEGSVDGSPRLDEASYRRELRELLLESQPLDPAELRRLADARAAFIRDRLVDDGVLEAARVRLLESTAVDGDDRFVRVPLEVVPR